jgi:hypothetical protein
MLTIHPSFQQQIVIIQALLFLLRAGDKSLELSNERAKFQALAPGL